MKYCRPFRTEAPGAAVEYGSCELSRDGKKLFTDKCGEDFENENGAGVTCSVNNMLFHQLSVRIERLQREIVSVTGAVILIQIANNRMTPIKFKCIPIFIF